MQHNLTMMVVDQKVSIESVPKYDKAAANCYWEHNSVNL